MSDVLLQGRRCRQQPPAGFKNKAGVKCRRSGRAPAVYLRFGRSSTNAGAAIKRRVASKMVRADAGHLARCV